MIDSIKNFLKENWTIITGVAVFISGFLLFVKNYHHLINLILQNRHLRKNQKKTDDNVMQFKINESNIIFTKLAIDDSYKLDINLDIVKNFILNDSTKHKDIYLESFKSITLSYSDYILVLSWNLEKLQIERLLKREAAYLNLDKWIECLSIYRNITNLPYRKNHNALFNRMQVNHTFDLFNQLLSKIDKYQKNIKSNYSLKNELQSYVDSASGSIDSGDFKSSISNLEITLSNIHKFLISNLPPEIASSEVKTKKKLTVQHSNHQFNILLVDDSLPDLQYLSEALLSSFSDNINIYSTHSGEEALKQLVEQDFDLVITDMRLLSSDGQIGLDGMEIAVNTKKISTKTKVILRTGYADSSRFVEGLIDNVDVFLSKHETSPTRITEEVKKLLNINYNR